MTGGLHPPAGDAGRWRRQLDRVGQGKADPGQSELRARGFHPCLPLTPTELAADAMACAAAGAVAVHVHPCDMQGEETLDPDAAGAAVAAVRRAVPGLQVSVSTGEWIDHDDQRRLHRIRAWGRLPPAARPDAATVNLSERSAPQVIAALAKAGIGLEAGLGSVADADRLMGLGLMLRLGLDDVAELPDGTPAADNAVLIAAGMRL